MKRFFKPEQMMPMNWPTGFVRLAVLGTVLVVLASSLAVAAPRGKLIKPGRLMIDGLRVNCGRTPVLISEHSPDFGAARRGLIILNPLKLRRLPRDAKLLVYYHECAHQHIGSSELAADCWAVQKVRREGLMDRAGLKKACSFIKRLPANRRHPSGIMRCRQMTRCFNQTFRQKAARQPALRARRQLSIRGFSKPVSAK